MASTQLAKFMGPTLGPPGSCRPQMGTMLVPWTLLSGKFVSSVMLIVACYFNHSGAGAKIFHENSLKVMAADAQALNVAG